MRVATMVSLGASAVLGLGALFVARVWLPSTGGADGGQAVIRAPAEAQASLVVAAGPIPYGVRLEPKYLTVTRLPVDAVPEGGFSTIDAVLKHDGGAPVALAPFSRREAILPSKLSGPGARASMAALITPGMRAYTIGVSDVAGVGGHALPGDRVDVILTRDLDPSAESQRLISDFVVQNVRLLGVDLNADPTSVKAAKPETATLEITAEEAKKLSVASTLGVLSLALRRTGASEFSALHPITGGDLGAAGATVRLVNPVAGGPVPLPPPPPPPSVQRVRAEPVRAPRAPVRPTFSRPSTSLVIVHGEEVAEVVVAAERGGGA